MDEQKQEKLKKIELWKTRRYFESTYEDAGVNIDFLIQLVREQENTINELSSIYELQYGAFNKDLQRQLEKYERIVESARHWRETRKTGAWSLEGGVKELTNMLKIREAREQALINAVDDLKA